VGTEKQGPTNYPKSPYPIDKLEKSKKPVNEEGTSPKRPQYTNGSEKILHKPITLLDTPTP